MAKIQKSHEPVDFNNLIYYFKDSQIPSISFSKFKGPLHTFKSIHNGNIPLEDVEKEQKSRIKQEDPKKINQKN